MTYYSPNVPWPKVAASHIIIVLEKCRLGQTSWVHVDKDESVVLRTGILPGIEGTRVRLIGPLFCFIRKAAVRVAWVQPSTRCRECRLL